MLSACLFSLLPRYRSCCRLLFSPPVWVFVLWLAVPAFAQHFVENEIIIKMKPGTVPLQKSGRELAALPESLTAALRAIDKYSVMLALPREATDTGATYLLFRFESAPAEAFSQLRALPEIEWAQYNHVLAGESSFLTACTALPPNDIPNDSLFAQQWALQKVRAPQAWQITTGARQVVIAVIDTGVELDHPDLQPNIWINDKEDLNHNGRFDGGDENGIDDDGNGFVDDVAGWDFTDAPRFVDSGDHLQRDNDPSDENGHGTAVAGIIAAAADNRLGIAGLAPQCRVMALRAGNSQGLLEEDDVAAAIVYAVQNGAAVINMSFGDAVVSPLLQDIIAFAHRRGVVLVAAAGNAASTVPYYPAGFSETIAVGASTNADRLASFSNYGTALDLVAPGENIWTTKLGKSFGLFDGTSAAAPLVSAVAGLLFSHHPDWSDETTRAAVQNSAVDLGEPGQDVFFGAGRLDAANALQLDRVARVEILSPAMDESIAGAAQNAGLVIVGTVLGAFVSSYTLSYGVGEAPAEWHLLSQSAGRQVWNDSLGSMPLQHLAEGMYTLRLRAAQQSGPSAEDQIRFYLDNTAPRVDALRLLPMVDGDHNSVLVEFKTDDLCHATLFFRARASTQEFQSKTLPYFTRDHHFNFVAGQAGGAFEFYIEVENGAGLSTRDDGGGRYHALQLPATQINAALFSELAFAPAQRIPDGYLLNRAFDWDGNGQRELILSVYQPNHAYGAITFFERTASGFVARFATSFPALPRDVGDSDHDGRMEILAGLGTSSFIVEAPSPGAFPTNVVWADSNDFWAARMADLDGDGKTEILGRRGNLYTILENNGAHSFQQIATLKNFTTGENLSGVPHVETGDFDGDGRQEILLGDADGDIYIYEASHDNAFRPTWSDSLPLLDTSDFIRALDFDGDGRMDFAAGCHSDPAMNSEHEFDSRHWLFRLYRARGDDQFEVVWEQRFYGMQAGRDYPAGLGSGDIDGDGRDELFLSLFPQYYLVDYENGKARVVWQYQPARSNTTVVDTLSRGQSPAFFFSDGEAFRAFTPPSLQTGPPAPSGFEATPLHAHAVSLTWRAVAGAERYRIQRATGDSLFRVLAFTLELAYVDTQVVAGQNYRYSVATIDLQMSPQIGPESPVRTARPAPPPRVLGAWYLPPYFVGVQFSDVMSETAGRTEAYQLRKIDGSAMARQPSSVVVARSGHEAILAFTGVAFAPGEYLLAVHGVESADRVVLDSAAAKATFAAMADSPGFYLQSLEVTPPQDLVLQFNLPVEKSSASRITNYALTATPELPMPVTIATATVAEDAPARVRLRLPPGLLAPAGRTFLLTARDLRSQAGISIQRGAGDALGFVLASSNLAQLKIYPNPFIASQHEVLAIAGLPPQAVIKILDESGRVLVTLQENDGNGGWLWHARDERGRPLPAGVYIAYVTAGTASAWAKFVIVR